MLPVSLIKIIKGKDKVAELESIYKSKENLEKIINSSHSNKTHSQHLQQWSYYEQHPDEELEDKNTLILDKMTFSDYDYEILYTIKNNDVKSLNDLANRLNKEVSTVQKKIKKLDDAELVTFERGSKNRKIPVVNYDKIEIPIF
ncbi:MAG: MarR family transcriptional regulator [Methanobrevibacter sp.]|jgi:DNA-binding MarR family transcriptional regulator|nr:MarR family transcriptional regulator [Candidatus Methanoflexus mossambicus]